MHAIAPGELGKLLSLHGQTAPISAVSYAAVVCASGRPTKGIVLLKSIQIPTREATELGWPRRACRHEAPTLGCYPFEQRHHSTRLLTLRRSLSRVGNCERRAPEPVVQRISYKTNN